MPDTPVQAVLALPIILLAAWLPGYLALVRLCDRQTLRPLERHFAALTLGLAGLGWLAFLLAQLGLFSLLLLAMLWLLLTVTIPLSAHFHTTRLNPDATPEDHPSTPPPLHYPRTSSPVHRTLEPALILLWLPVALFLFLRPHEAILGAADAGVYVSTAAHIAREGGILVTDATLGQMDPALQDAVLRPIPDASLTPAYLFPGFNVATASSGAIIPDFFHFHATWQAVAFAVAGLIAATPAALHAALLMPGLWALLGAIAIYLTLFRLLADHLAQLPGNALPAWLATLFAALALAVLSLSAIQVWFARYPVAETLTQYLLWTALWALGAWLSQEEPLPVWGLLAALSLGLLVLTRIDMIFVLAIPVLTGAWHIGRRALRRVHAWFYVPMALLALHAALHAAFISRPYFNRIAVYGQQLFLRFWPFMIVAVLALLAGLWLLLRHGQRLTLMPLRRPLLALVAGAILLLAAYGWFLRPVYGALPSYTEWYDGQTIVLTDRENLRRLGWYLSPLGILLGVAGAVLMTWRANRRILPVLGAGLFFSLLYLWRIQANPHQIYVMRRYVPVVAPFFIVSGAYLLHALAAAGIVRAGVPTMPATTAGNWRVLSRLALPLLVLLLGASWLGATAWSARGFVTQVDYRGLIRQLDRLDQQLEPNSILLFNEQATITQGDILGTPLHYAFGHDVFSLRDPRAVDDATMAKSIENWQNQGRSVYWIGAPDWLAQQNIEYTSSDTTITTSALEGSYDHKPYRINSIAWTLNLHHIALR